MSCGPGSERPAVPSRSPEHSSSSPDLPLRHLPGTACGRTRDGIDTGHVRHRIFERWHLRLVLEYHSRERFGLKRELIAHVELDQFDASPMDLAGSIDCQPAGSVAWRIERDLELQPSM